MKINKKIIFTHAAGLLVSGIASATTPTHAVDCMISPIHPVDDRPVATCVVSIPAGKSNLNVIFSNWKLDDPGHSDPFEAYSCRATLKNLNPSSTIITGSKEDYDVEHSWAWNDYKYDISIGPAGKQIIFRDSTNRFFPEPLMHKVNFGITISLSHIEKPNAISVECHPYHRD